jgi:DNA-binding winged helix-turn-helix (wHTH) protein
MIYHFGPYQLDVHRGELRCASRPVVLEPKVLDVLVYLIEHRGRIVTKEELLEHAGSGPL